MGKRHVTTTPTNAKVVSVVNRIVGRSSLSSIAIIRGAMAWAKSMGRASRPIRVPYP